VNFDTIIVGAGAAGCVLATRLTEDPDRSVLLIEAGPDYPDLTSLPEDVRLGYLTPSGMIARGHDWGYVGRAGDETEPIARGKLVGGSSAVNAQIYLWGLPYDFDRWAEAGNEGWSWDDVEPWFRKVETDLDFVDGHGQAGPILVRRYLSEDWLDLQKAFYEACLDAGYEDCPDLNRPYATGVGPYPMNNPDGIRISAAVGYLNPVRGRSNLTILPDALVKRIVVNNSQACGVEIVRGRDSSTVESDDVVIACGAIGSPLLLQRSGIGDATTLMSFGVDPVTDLPGVGQNLRDHPAVPMYWQATDTGPAHAHWHQVGLRYSSAGSEDRDDMIVYVAHIRDEPKLLMRPTVNLAKNAGRVGISSSNVDAHPHIDYGLFSHPLDRQRMREAIRLCHRLSRHDAFSEHIDGLLQPDPSDLDDDSALDAHILRLATTGHHVSGTCKMGPPSDPLAVVDEYGRVYGVENLRVTDASTMPDCVRANIHATVLMMAERFASTWSSPSFSPPG